MDASYKCHFNKKWVQYLRENTENTHDNLASNGEGSLFTNLEILLLDFPRKGYADRVTIRTGLSGTFLCLAFWPHAGPHQPFSGLVILFCYTGNKIVQSIL